MESKGIHQTNVGVMENKIFMVSVIVSINKDMEQMNALRNLSLKENASSATNKVINPQNAKLRNGTLLNS